MKRMILSAIAACAALTAFGIAASQAWVMKYCADHGMTVSTNASGTAYTSSGKDGSSLSFSIVKPSVFAIVATNCDEAATADGVTNGMRFAYHRPYAVFLNEPAHKRIWVDVNPGTLEQTYIYNSWTGMVTDTRMWMVDAQTNRHFRIYWTHLSANDAHSLTNGFTAGGAQ